MRQVPAVYKFSFIFAVTEEVGVMYGVFNACTFECYLSQFSLLSFVFSYRSCFICLCVVAAMLLCDTFVPIVLVK